MKAKPLPEISPCWCKSTNVMLFPARWRSYVTWAECLKCRTQGPAMMTDRGAINAWNREMAKEAERKAKAAESADR